MNGKSLITPMVLMGLLLQGNSGAQENEPSPAIKRLNGVEPNSGVFHGANRNRPLILRNENDAKRYFAGQNLAKLTKQADFQSQYVLVFSWQGSGQDRLDHVVMESYPEQVLFTLKPGRTRDLRPHVYVYVLRSNVKWHLADSAHSGPVDHGDQYVQVKVKGKLRSQIFAIGGETTGVAISARGITWELDFGKDSQTKSRAEQLDGKTVLVTGQLNVKRGVEVRQRWIVTVQSLEEPGR